MSQNSTTQSQERTPAPPGEGGSIRWKPALVIAGVYLAFVLLVLGARLPFRDLILASSTALTAALLTGWFLIFSGFSGLVRIAGLVLGIAVVGAGANAIQFKGYKGDMALDWDWSWKGRGVPDSIPQEPTTSAVASVANPTAGQDCPGFLGADRLGVVRGVTLVRDWEAHPPKKIWERPVGLGWSSFSVVGDYAVTQEQRDKVECVVCYDLQTGVQRWAHEDVVRFNDALGGPGPRATPTLHEGKVYALGATGILNCLELESGKLIWSTNILEDAGATNRTWGMAGSPLVYDDVVVVNPGGKDHSVVAYDRETGKLRWHAGDSPSSYSSPMLATLDGVRQVVMFNGDALEGYAADGSGQLWHFDWVTNGSQRTSVSQPVILPRAKDAPERIFISAGYGKGCALIEVTHEGEKFSAALSKLWEPNIKLKAKFTNMVYHKGYVYALDERILTCMDPLTGKPQWPDKGGRYGYGQILLVGDVLLVQAESGDVVLVEATPEEFRELASFAPLTDKTWNHPVLVGRLLLIRNDRQAACYEVPIATSE